METIARGSELGTRGLCKSPPGTPLGDLRWAQNLSQAELGSLLLGSNEPYVNRNQQVISRLEHGLIRITHEYILKIARALNATPERIEFLYDQGYDKRNGEQDMPIQVSQIKTEMPPTRRGVEGRELEQLVGMLAWNLAGAKPNQAVKLAEVEILSELGKHGFYSSPAQIRGALVNLMKSRRLTVVRETAEHGTRVYRTTPGLRAFAGIALLPDDIAPAAIPNVDNATNSPNITFAAQEIILAEELPMPTLTAPEKLTQTFSPETFDDMMLDLLTRASAARSAEADAQLATEKVRTIALQRNQVVKERDAALARAETAELRVTSLEGRSIALDGRQKHGLKKAVYILEQLRDLMENPMFVAMLGTVNVKRDDVAEAAATTASIAGVPEA